VIVQGGNFVNRICHDFGKSTAKPSSKPTTAYVPPTKKPTGKKKPYQKPNNINAPSTAPVAKKPGKKGKPNNNKEPGGKPDTKPGASKKKKKSPNKKPGGKPGGKKGKQVKPKPQNRPLLHHPYYRVISLVRLLFQIPRRNELRPTNNVALY